VNLPPFRSVFIFLDTCFFLPPGTSQSLDLETNEFYEPPRYNRRWFWWSPLDSVCSFCDREEISFQAPSLLPVRPVFPSALPPDNSHSPISSPVPFRLSFKRIFFLSWFYRKLDIDCSVDSNTKASFPPIVTTASSIFSSLPPYVANPSPGPVSPFLPDPQSNYK